jgi:hypothetical protein
MSYFIFTKNEDNVEGSLYKIAENEFDLNNLNINKNDYKIIEDNLDNFNAVRLNEKNALGYNQDNIIYRSSNINMNKFLFELVLNNNKYIIKNFLNSQENHPNYQKWNNYFNELLKINPNNISYPFTKSIEKYIEEQGKPSLNTLQLP